MLPCVANPAMTHKPAIQLENNLYSIPYMVASYSYNTGICMCHPINNSHMAPFPVVVIKVIIILLYVGQ